MAKPIPTDYLPSAPWKLEKISETHYKIVSDGGPMESRNAPEFKDGMPEWTKNVAEVDYSNVEDQATAAKTARVVARLIQLAPVFANQLVTMVTARRDFQVMKSEEILDQFEEIMLDFLEMEPVDQARIREGIKARKEARSSAEQLMKIFSEVADKQEPTIVRRAGIVGNNGKVEEISSNKLEYPDAWPGSEAAKKWPAKV